MKPDSESTLTRQSVMPLASLSQHWCTPLLEQICYNPIFTQNLTLETAVKLLWRCAAESAVLANDLKQDGFIVISLDTGWVRTEMGNTTEELGHGCAPLDVLTSVAGKGQAVSSTGLAVKWSLDPECTELGRCLSSLAVCVPVWTHILGAWKAPHAMPCSLCHLHSCWGTRLQCVSMLFTLCAFMLAS